MFNGDREFRFSLSKRSDQIAEEFHAARTVAPLFISAQSVKLIESVAHVFHIHISPFPPKAEDWENRFDELNAVRIELIQAAKRDLKIRD